MKSTSLEIDTSERWYVDLTEDARRFVAGGGDGLLNVFVPHATAGLAVLELGDGSEPDLDRLLDRLFPRDTQYTHQHGSPGHGADHLLPVLLAPSLTVPVAKGTLLLGTWQHLVFIDRNRDNPHRQVRLTLLQDSAR